MTVDLNSLKLSLEDVAAGGTKERMISLRDSLVQKKHVLTRMVGTETSPGLYPANLKKSIQGAGALEAMSDSSKSVILQEFQTYTSGIEYLIKKIHEETLALVSVIFTVEKKNDPATIDA